MAIARQLSERDTIHIAWMDLKIHYIYDIRAPGVCAMARMALLLTAALADIPGRLPPMRGSP
jgi:hypothetical protein